MPLIFNPETNLYEYTPTPEQLEGERKANEERRERVNRVLEKHEEKKRELSEHRKKKRK